MRKLLLFLSIFTTIPIVSAAQSYEGSFTTGLFGGTPFWSRQNLEDRLVSGDNDFFRFYNRLRAKASYGQFSVRTSIIRNDLMKIGDGKVMFPNADEAVNETKLYQLFAEYNEANLHVKAGRFTTLNRWYYNSVDGAYASYNLTDELSVMAYGGMDVNYASDFGAGNEKHPLGYAEVAYRKEVFGGKAKFMYLQDSYRTGFDLYGGIGTFRFSLDAGYDISHQTLFDGSLAMYGYITPKFTVSANITRVTPLEWGFWRDHYVDRFQVSGSYKIMKNISLSLQQQVSRYDERLDYLTYLSLGHRHFFAGLNYITGDSGNRRLGVSLGGNYSLMHNMKIAAGIATVDYLFNHDIVDDQNRQSYSSFLTLNYKPWEFMDVRGHISYYHQFEAMPQKLRGGIAFQFNFEGGDK